MATFLFQEIVFGPVKSRRLGNSLGINVLPEGKKICNFNCIYCECGWNSTETQNLSWPSVQFIEEQLRKKIILLKQQHIPVDTITFAGNGEPTMHPYFPDIIEITLKVRDNLLPGVPIAVLSNATLIFKPEIRKALMKIEQNILKLDSAINETILTLNQPTGYFNLDETIHNLRLFEGHCTIQTMFVRGYINNNSFDNTTEKELNAWLNALKIINPQQIMIYSISRDTPIEQIEKISLEELNLIAKRATLEGFKVEITS